MSDIPESVDEKPNDKPWGPDGRFVSGDPRQRPSRGRPSKTYLKALETLEGTALEVIERAMTDPASKWSVRVAAAQDVLSRRNGKPTERSEVAIEGGVRHEVVFVNDWRDSEPGSDLPPA